MLYLYGKDDGNVYYELDGSLELIGPKPPNENMFSVYGTAALSNVATKNATSVYTYNSTPVLNLVANVVYTGKTVIQQTDWIVPSLSKITFNNTSAAGTTIKVLVSVDSGASWYTYSSGAWSLCSLNDIATLGTPIANVANITAQAWSNIIPSSRPVRLAYYLKESSAANNIYLNEIRLDY